LLPLVNAQRCTGCGWCVAACPPHVLSLQVRQGHKTSVLHDAAACTGCSRCETRCPFQAITMQRASG
jgi:NAD-dependent dihydropyrimidine dehydrogenase PreA subunit